jgi:hypothetical protein
MTLTQRRWRRAVHDLEKRCGVGPQVHLSCLYAGMPQPQRHLADVTSRVEYQKSTRMSETVWRHTFCQKTWAAPRRGLNMFVQNVLESGTSERGLKVRSSIRSPTNSETRSPAE